MIESGTDDQAPDAQDADDTSRKRPAPRRLRAGDAERDAVLEVITEAHGAGRLDPEEVDERQRLALRARFVDELPDLIDDLPEGELLAVRLQHQADQAAQKKGPGSALAPRGQAPSPAVRGPGEVVPARTGAWSDDNSVAIMSGREVDVAPGTTIFRTYALMGGDEVYLTDAMGPGVEVTVESYSMWAGNTVYVPPGVRVIDRTVNIMAGNDISKKAQGDGSNGTLVLAGFSIMAGHDVKLDRRSRRQGELNA